MVNVPNRLIIPSPITDMMTSSHSFYNYEDHMDPCSNPELLLLEEARSFLINKLPIIATSAPCSYHSAHGHYLAKRAQASTAIPSFPNSAMDGYAFAYEDLAKYQNLAITQKILAGDTHQYKINAGECARIMTGAPMPQGADTVVMQEHTQTQGTKLTVTKRPKQHANVRLAGDSIAKDAIVAEQGERLNAAHIGLLASIGTQQVECYQPITVGIFSTGDELKAPGEILEFGQIYDSNRAMLIAMLAHLPVKVIDFGAIDDSLENISNVLLKANSQCDVILSSAGVSVGTADFTKDALEKLGKIEFWKVAMKPGKPVAFGQLSDSYFFGLPGNPVSAAVTFLQLVKPALEKLGGGNVQIQPQWQAKASAKFKKKPGRTDFQRAIANINAQGQWEVKPVGSQSSASLLSFTQANCFAVIELERGDVEPGENITIEMFPALLVM
ncbi:molybdopterin molybdotransferase MoeA [Celerinatantimonas diazotrophica]|uniref:Molybdopterin molybdenumtransferase n=1 Tax=Celerinatantimonas diazotrophica TaxID=412034 RepID=A0A4R1JAC8_9GAMM|nr:gephyrin-like molybdotransferase Glp [Celerinatantimonas diazotrophica]TCK47595.1 molybdopterin molybdochelatase [Celerinatantimonas diazotrophica]CAG9296782.1 Molybdopterin molybdenumtransferase [Celerinatantimonas diazotrophica]